MIIVFPDCEYQCAECGVVMVSSTKTLSDAEEPYRQFWCITDDCSQKDKQLRISPLRFPETVDDL